MDGKLLDELARLVGRDAAAAVLGTTDGDDVYAVAAWARGAFARPADYGQKAGEIAGAGATWGDLVVSGQIEWETAALFGSVPIRSAPAKERDAGIMAILRALTPAPGSAASDPAAVEAFARSLEDGCYRRVVDVARQEGRERRWTSAPFRARYGQEVGRIARRLGGHGTLASAIWRREGRDPPEALLPRVATATASATATAAATTTATTFAAPVVPVAPVVPTTSLEFPSEAARVAEVAAAVAAGRAPVKKKGSRMYECPVCKVRDVEYSEHHTRSPDEPLTALCRCLRCGHDFRV